MRIVVLLFLLAPFFSLAQGPKDSTTVIQLEREEQAKMEFSGVFKSSISLELAGKSGWVGASYDLLLSRRLRLGIGVGYPGAGLDFKCYPYGVGRDKFIFNLGLRANVIMPPGDSQYAFYSLPIGFSYFAANRINFDLDVGPMYKYQIDNGSPETGISSQINYVWFSAKIGYRFSFYAMRRARQLDKMDE